MKVNRWCLVMVMALAILPAAALPLGAADAAREFRQQNGLQAYEPPDWFLGGDFIAAEKKPAYVFGTVRDFVKALGAPATWLIEDLEFKRLEAAVAAGKKPEYTLYLETVSPGGPQYWVFVAMPHDSAQAWFDARRAFHGSKAEDYYGATRGELDGALRQGVNVKAELRFLIENGNVSLEVPEDLIQSRYRLAPVFDLHTGRRMGAGAANR